MSSSVANNQHLQLTRQLITFSKKNRKIFLALNCLKRIMSQLLDYTKKIDKKSRKIIFGSKLSAPNNEPTLRIPKKLTKNREKLFLAQNCLHRIMSQL